MCGLNSNILCTIVFFVFFYHLSIMFSPIKQKTQLFMECVYFIHNFILSLLYTQRNLSVRIPYFSCSCSTDAGLYWSMQFEICHLCSWVTNYIRVGRKGHQETTVPDPSLATIPWYERKQIGLFHFFKIAAVKISVFICMFILFFKIQRYFFEDVSGKICLW